MYEYEPWMSVNKVHISLNGVVWFISEPGKANGENHDAILMQFTGLKDKNGVEIYEGDVCEWLGEGNLISGNRFTVFWNANTVRWYLGDCLSPIDMGNTQVIGNIYENPELANKKEEQEC